MATTNARSMRYLPLSALSLLLSCLSATAQNTITDSLARMLHTAKADTSRSLIHAQLSRAYMYSRPDTALWFAEQGLGLARAARFPKGEAHNLTSAANTFLNQGNAAKALEVCLDALLKAEEIGDRPLQARVIGNVGAIYSMEGDYPKALEYGFKALAIAKELGDERRQQRSLNNIGDTYEKLGRLDSARAFMNRAYDLAVKLDDHGAIGMALNNFGNIHARMGQPEVAMGHYRMSLPYYTATDDDDGICESSLGMARLFAAAGQHDSALYHARNAYALSEAAGFTQRVMTAAGFLADHYRARAMVDSAYKYLTAVITVKDTLFNQEKARHFQSLSFDEAMRQHDLAMQRARAEQERAHNMQYAFIAIGIVTFILVFFLLSNSVVVNEKWVHFLGVLGLLLVFEFINLYFHGIIAELTHHSPLLMLLALVAIAALLIPLHHRIEHWVTHRIVAKNKKLQLAAARKALARLEADVPAAEAPPAPDAGDAPTAPSR